MQVGLRSDWRKLDQACVFLQQRLEKGRQIMSEIKAKKTVQNTQLLCRFCSRLTQRHLEFCATCGKRQVFF
jgi:rRNA maturation endonuclease Nob1